LLEHICCSIDASKEVWGYRQGVAIIFGNPEVIASLTAGAPRQLVIAFSALHKG
jgi:hypothetical protein